MPVEYQKLRDADLFKSLSDDVLRQLAEHCDYLELPAGATLFPQNAPGDAFYLLETGQVHVVREYPDGEQVILVTEGPYYVIGELSMLMGQPRTGAVVAVSDCSLIALKKEGFDEVCARMPQLAVQVMQYLGMRLYRMNLLVRENAIGNAAARVANLLLLLAGERAGPVGSKISLNHVARATAADVDVVQRLLQEWASEGYISIEDGQITVHNVETLRDIAG